MIHETILRYNLSMNFRESNDFPLILLTKQNKSSNRLPFLLFLSIHGGVLYSKEVKQRRNNQNLNANFSNKCILKPLADERRQPDFFSSKKKNMQKK